MDKTILENNAILKAILKNQVQMMVILEEAVDRLNEDSLGQKDEKYIKKMQQIRSALAENLYNQIILTIKGSL